MSVTIVSIFLNHMIYHFECTMNSSEKVLYIETTAIFVQECLLELSGYFCIKRTIFPSVSYAPSDKISFLFFPGLVFDYLSSMLDS